MKEKSSTATVVRAALATATLPFMFPIEHCWVCMSMYGASLFMLRCISEVNSTLKERAVGTFVMDVLIAIVGSLLCPNLSLPYGIFAAAAVTIVCMPSPTPEKGRRREKGSQGTRRERPSVVNIFMFFQGPERGSGCAYAHDCTEDSVKMLDCDCGTSKLTPLRSHDRNGDSNQ